MCSFHSSYDGKPKVGGSRSRPAWTKKRDPISKITRAKRTGIVTLEVEHPPGKSKALSSNPTTAKKKKKKKEK
jgi:hypothetical protein